MTWQCITEGADGIVFYSWYDIRRDPNRSFGEAWDDVRRVAAEVKEWAPVLLSVEPVPQVALATSDSVHWTARRVGNTLYLVFVNDGTERASVQGMARVIEGADRKTVSVRIALPPYAVRIEEIAL
jgi:hypothetical protein